AWRPDLGARLRNPEGPILLWAKVCRRPRARSALPRPGVEGSGDGDPPRPFRRSARDQCHYIDKPDGVLTERRASAGELSGGQRGYGLRVDGRRPLGLNRLDLGDEGGDGLFPIRELELQLHVVMFTRSEFHDPSLLPLEALVIGKIRAGLQTG